LTYVAEIPAAPWENELFTEDGSAQQAGRFNFATPPLEFFIGGTTHTLMTSTEPPVSKDRRVSAWWRVLAIFLALSGLLAWAASTSMIEQLKSQVQLTQAKLGEVPQVRYVAVLEDEKQLPALLVTLDPKQASLQVQRLNDVKEGREDTMQLWAFNGDQAPRSLGVITSKYKTMQIPVEEAALTGATELAISVEAKGGVTETQGPRLPYLFKGWLVQKSI
jgi:anti-sigma-K factor RskA